MLCGNMVQHFLSFFVICDLSFGDKVNEPNRPSVRKIKDYMDNVFKNKRIVYRHLSKVF